MRTPTPTPFSMGYFYSPALKRRVAQAIERERFDLIFVHCSSVAQYVSNVVGIPKILDFGDMDSQKWLIYGQVRAFPLSLAYLLEGTKLEAEEKRPVQVVRPEHLHDSGRTRRRCAVSGRASNRIGFRTASITLTSHRSQTRMIPT